MVPFKLEQQPVVEDRRDRKAVLVADHGVGQRADLQPPVPVGVVARQAGDFQPEQDPGPAYAHLRYQPLEPFPVGGRGTGLALIDIDSDHLLGPPALRGSVAVIVMVVSTAGHESTYRSDSGRCHSCAWRPGSAASGSPRRECQKWSRVVMQCR
jgi:hypothetical protein